MAVVNELAEIPAGGYELVWIPLGVNHPVGMHLPHLHGMQVPHCLRGSVESVGGMVSMELDSHSAGEGALLARGGPPGTLMGHPDDDGLREVLRVLQRQTRVASVDSVCAGFAAKILERHGVGSCIRALRRAVELVPAGPMSRADLVVNLYWAIRKYRLDPAAVLSEVALLTRPWLDLDTTACPNEGLVLACAATAFGFLGDTEAVERCLKADSPVIPGHEYLDRNRDRIRSIRPEHVDEIQFMVDQVERLGEKM